MAAPASPGQSFTGNMKASQIQNFVGPTQRNYEKQKHFKQMQKTKYNHKSLEPVKKEAYSNNVELLMSNK